ncbi:hypothetical protein SDC9_106818 [bioreactor metagenome]|uniref:Uncharacterized protein n=1 Tax=bioreactor metagenome TaxID=1076179 RepID=A0A645B3E2_9ZZZZ
MLEVGLLLAVAIHVVGHAAEGEGIRRGHALREDDFPVRGDVQRRGGDFHQRGKRHRTGRPRKGAGRRGDVQRCAAGGEYVLIEDHIAAGDDDDKAASVGHGHGTVERELAVDHGLRHGGRIDFDIAADRGIAHAGDGKADSNQRQIPCCQRAQRGDEQRLFCGGTVLQHNIGKGNVSAADGEPVARLCKDTRNRTRHGDVAESGNRRFSACRERPVDQNVPVGLQRQRRAAQAGDSAEDQIRRRMDGGGAVADGEALERNAVE